jgi:hypothetical protein
VPLYELRESGLHPFERVGGPEVYEERLQELVWDNLEAVIGQPMFPVAQKKKIQGGGVPDLIALDRGGHVAVMELKRDVDRNQLSQALEYAGWAQSASLDELAHLYEEGPDKFFSDWGEFTETEVPKTLSFPPHVFLIARDVHPRTERALRFIAAGQVPITMIRASFYKEEGGAMLLDVSEPQVAPVTLPPTGIDGGSGLTLGGRVTLADLVEAGILMVGDKLSWERKKLGVIHHATLTKDAALELENGSEFATPSGAAGAVAGTAIDGWNAWKVSRLGGILLAQLRSEFLKTKEEEP